MINRTNVVLIVVLIGFFMEFDKVIGKFFWKSKGKEDL